MRLDERQRGGEALSQAQARRWAALEQKARLEQASYREWQWARARAETPSRYGLIAPEVEKAAAALLAPGMSWAVEAYPQLYSKLLALDPLPAQLPATPARLGEPTALASSVARRGKAGGALAALPTWTLPAVTTDAPIRLVDSAAEWRRGGCGGIEETPTSQPTALSFDREAMQHAREAGAHVVLCSSAFRALARGIVSKAEPLDLPLTVRQEAGGSRIFLDKPLPRTTATARLKTGLVYQAGVRSRLAAAAAAAAGGTEGGGGGAAHSYALVELGSLKLLVRCKHHGRLGETAAGRSDYVSAKVRVEYLLPEALEEYGLSEYVDLWGHCAVRPAGCSLLLCRVRAATSDWSASALLRRDALPPPPDCLSPDLLQHKMHTLLTRLATLPVGGYLLRRPQSSPKFAVWSAGGAEQTSLLGALGGKAQKSSPAAATAGSTFDLHAALSAPCATDTKTVTFHLPQWTSPAGATPRIPNTFPPRPEPTAAKPP